MKKTILIPAAGNSREDGAALLFALGFLSMMLVLGLGFVTTSLLSQKIAANNSTRTQARLLARSAAARAALYIMLYNDQAIINGETLSGYDAICSYDVVNANDNGTALTTTGDQLRKSGDSASDYSKLKYQTGGVDYSGETSDAKWIYFYDSPDGGSATANRGRKIIGRAAFQVLPRVAGRLSLYGVTGGAKLENDLGVNPPQNFRWGRAVDELFLDNTQALSTWTTEVSPAANPVPSTYDILYTTYSGLFSSDTANKKKWIEYWFAEGKDPVLKEAYPVLDPADSSGKTLVYNNRFNIGDYYYTSADRNAADKDNWYDRFLKPADGSGWTGVTDALKNSEETLTALTAESVEYNEDNVQDSALDSFGLPFLKRIGNEAHGFASLDLLRKQIAANFNDYCDKDSVPTSDKAAGMWSVTDTSNYPSYTGNEKTLYINEVALKLADITAKFSAGTLTVNGGGANHSKVEITSITPKVIAELVNMYDNSGSPEMLNPANFEFQTALKKLSFNLALKVTFNIKFTYTTGSPAVTHTATTTATVNYSDNAVAKVNFAPTAPTAPTITAFGALANGYSVGSAALDNIEAASITQPDASIFAAKINDAKNAALPAGGTFQKYTSIEVARIGYQLHTDSSSKINFYPFLLKAKSTVTDDAKGKGVDFVRMDKAGEMTLSLSSSAAATSDENVSGNSHKFQAAAFIGGIEARDPRQNLNPNYSDLSKSDWNLTPTLIDGAAAGITIPSMTVASNNVTAGQKNRDTNPAAPSYLNASGTAVAINADDVDVETASDPAWLGDNAGQHVSTAYIRNAPMASPWEVGLIHRGREWRTLNIKSAGGFGAEANIAIKDVKSAYPNWTDPGTTYKNGDGAILEYIKMNQDCRSMGKIPLTLLRTAVISGGSDWNKVPAAYNKDLVKMLFDHIRVGQTMKQFYTETTFGSPTAQGGVAISTSDAKTNEFVAAVDALTASGTTPEFKLRSQFLNSDYGVNSGAFTFGLAQSANDALQEELIGKTINLLAVNEETPPNIFKVIVLAQTVKDIGGIGAGINISKLHNGVNTGLSCLLGQFDFISDSNSWENNTYFDEITGEVKALVTIERVPAQDNSGNQNPDYGRMVITNIEYID